MPGAIAAPVPIGVLPWSLCTAFAEASDLPCNVNEYHDGTTHRGALVTTGRRRWRLAKRLTPAQMVTLREFRESHDTAAFYFYSWKEGAHDASGVSTAGRYTVRFASGWAQQMGIARGDTEVELLEVGAGASVATSIKVFLKTSAEGNATYTPRADGSIYPNVEHALDFLFRNIPEAGYTEVTDSADLTEAEFANLGVYTTIVGSIGGTGLARLHVIDCWVEATYDDLPTITMRPTEFRVDLGDSPGANVVNGTALGAIVERSSYGPLQYPPVFSMHGFV